MTGVQSDLQAMLPGVRRGDFAALAAVVDLLSETDPKWAETNWNRRLDYLRWLIRANAEGRRSVVPVNEWARRSIKGVLIALNKRAGARWRLPAMRSRDWRKEPLHSQTCQLRDGLVRLVKATIQ